ncbi:CusA/CzcA family heavy metal efflux RND transporter [Halosquirtibacter laminarini]|uniref:CusA/CzcA family heavy metal efflux RND transporter n=1 Tax=Halosquirtibacter laminarini TaxID=3374600 RepID=A0AC61NP51_9BACT|nr:CusA/CzcA family heavy metal efflux RND transporter [Prolixibacteraceae bacterium]
MIDKIISFSIKNKFFIVLLTIALIVGGIYSMKSIPLDATPDITNNQVQVITVSPNLGTEDMEKFVTYQVELAMSNLPKVTELRSVSRFGLSVVTIVFDDDMGTYLPRQLVSEALGEVEENIPEGFGKPFMAPISTGLGEVYQYTLEVDSAHKSMYTPQKLRTIQDWIVKRQMAMTPGVVEVNSFGGYTKQYEIAIDPDKLRSMNISISEVFEAVKKNNQNTGGAYIEKNYKVNYIRGEGLVRSLDDIRDIVIDVRNGAPIYIRDIANVHYGNAIRYGAFTRNGQGEAVGGIVMMLKGANSNKVIATVKDRMALIQKSLPKGVRVVPFLDRSEMIKKTTSTVAENLALGALIVIFVLVLILGNVRGGLIVASTIPLSLLFAFIMMKCFNVWANLMSLGAIDFGILIDGAVIIVESMVFYLHEKHMIGKKLSSEERNELSFKSSSTMMNSAFFGQIIIMIVFIPIMVLGGIEGKMFRPMALTFSFAVIGVLILCLTYIPMMSALFLRAPKNNKRSFGDKVVSALENIYRPVLNWALSHTKTIIGSSLALLLVSIGVFSRMGGEFIPQLDEGNVALHILMQPGTALSEMASTSTKVEKLLLKKFPDEIKSIQTRIGVADIPTDPMPMDIGDSFVILNPQSQWTATDNKEELVTLFKKTVQSIPGVNYEFSQPVEMRFNELLTGIREDLAIKIYGEDLEVLAKKASEIEKLIANIPGVGDLRAEAIQGLPQITIHYNRNKIAQYGLDIEKLNQMVSIAFGGQSTGVTYEGEKRFDIVVRYDASHRADIQDVKDLNVDLPNGNQIPLKELAMISYKPGPMQISRDNTNRRTYVGVNVRGRDVKSLVYDIQNKLDSELDLPAGYFIRYGGAFENLQRATNRLKVVVPIALIVILLLVYVAVKSFKQTLMIYAAIPLAAVGGIFSLYLRGLPFSISAGVGFIVLFGVAVMNGLVLIGGLNELHKDGNQNLKDLISLGAIRRIRPIILTASTDILGFLPMAVSTSAGAEVQRPLATVVIGGMITATLLTLLVLPVLYQWVMRPSKKQRDKKSSSSNGIVIGAVVLLMFVGVNKSYAQTVKVDLNSAIKITKKNYPQIKAARLNVVQQKELKRTAWDFGTTGISTSADETNSVAPGTVNNIAISQSNIDLFTVGAKKKLLESNIHTAEASSNLVEDQVILQMTQAFNKVVYRNMMVDLYSSLDTIYDNFVSAAEMRYKMRESSKLDYLSALTRYKEFQLTVQRVKGEQEVALKNLNQFLMLEDSIVIAPMTSKLASFDTDTLVNSSLNLASTKIEQASKNYKMQKLRFLPTINASYKKQSVDGSSGYYGYEIGISIPLFNGQSARSKAAKVRVQIAQQNYQTQLIDNQTLYAKMQIRYKVLKDVQDYYNDEALPLVEEQISATQLAYKAGEIGYVEFVQNIDSSISTKEKYLESYLSLLDVVASLKYITGSI